MSMRVFMRRLHARVRGADACAIDGNELDGEPLNIQGAKLLFQHTRIDTGADQGAEYHVTAGAGETVKVESLHVLNVETPMRDLEQRYDFAGSSGQYLVAKI